MKKYIGLSLITIALVGCGGGSSSSSSSSDDTSPATNYVPYDAVPISAEDKAAFLDSTNAARSVQQDCGEYGIYEATSPVAWSDELYKAAMEHSVDMAKVGENSPDIAHEGSGGETDWTAQVLELGRGSSPWERGQNNGWDNADRSTSGEVAHSYPETIDVAMKDWIESDGHCAIIMDPEQTHVGMAVHYNPESAWLYYWTGLFGQKH